MRYDTFSQLISNKAEKNPNKIFLLYDRNEGKGIEKITYLEFKQAVDAKAKELSESPYSCIGIAADTSLEWLIYMFASAISGRRTVLFPSDENDDKMKMLIQITETDLLITNKGPKETFLAKKDSGIKKPEDIECSGKLLFFTSGTTGRNKAVVLSQYAVLTAAWKGNCMMECKEKDILLSLLPLFHIFGFICTMLWPMCSGATIALGRGLMYMMDDFEHFKPTVVSVVPTMLRFLLATDSLNNELDALLVGAGPCDEETLAETNRRNLDLRYGYGLTETASGLAISLAGENPYDMAICPETELSIDPKTGELLVKTTAIMDGYFRNPEATAKVLKNGVLHTGDVVEITENNRVHIKGRLDDMVALPNGENINLSELETKLSAILDTETVVKVENGTPILIIYTEDDSQQKDMKKKVSEFNQKQPLGKRLSKVLFTNTPFPHTATGKVQRWNVVI